MVQGIRCKYLIESVLVAYFLEIICLSEIYAAQCISLPWFFFATQIEYPLFIIF